MLYRGGQQNFRKTEVGHVKKQLEKHWFTAYHHVITKKLTKTLNQENSIKENLKLY